ncbi:Acetamidase regulatory protein [Wickerhamomyces ciferrii]|uniref:Acetamidase regulatory protein n=1 Tax=Wickerhamomyces ciferrii (strain ATCC 14091 / BCRC 22168 / CBS 111 / JCM 3599 / NBRC 0793 / NRRL Y-1031 F-60-10) TaxID=1206466 RepID=K0KFV3_WICCF|nr:Acetamidase regulatory protein [Wickerhamomyces ciferrii]CCH41781.1 Acetamidase regulatory protein [Wickerhamomyces ciferrii]
MVESSTTINIAPAGPIPEPANNIPHIDQTAKVDEATKDSDQPKRRPRRSYNCGPCKRQKIKCDTQIPCAACKRHNRIDQCLASPPNPPSPDHKKKIRRISIQELSENSTPTVRSPNQNIENHVTPRTIKLPMGYYTSSFKINDSTESSNGGSLTPDEQMIDQFRDYRIGSPNKLLPKPWKNNPQEYKEHRNDEMFLKPLNNNHDDIFNLMKDQIEFLNVKLVSLESKIEKMNHKNTMKLPIDDNIFKYLTAIPHRVSFDDSQDQKSLNIKFLAPDKLDDWNDFIHCLPNMKFMTKMKKYFIEYLNFPIELISTKVLDSCFNEQIFKKTKDQVTTQDWESLSLVAIICSLSMLNYPKAELENVLKIDPDNVIYMSNTLFQVSKNCLNILKYRESPKLIHLQILILCHRYLQYFNKNDLLIITNSEMVSIAYALGLHGLPTPQNSLETEVSHKVWWIVCLKDTLVSLKLKTPPFIRIDSLPNTKSRESHILKAFVPAEISSFDSVLTPLVKVTKLLNEIPPALAHSSVEKAERLIMIDRQLTSVQIQANFRFMTSNRDQKKCFQEFYLYSVCIFGRLKVYEGLYFTSQEPSGWIVLSSIIESFFKKYADLRRVYDIKEEPSFFLGIVEQLIMVLVQSLIISILNPNVLPDNYKTIINSYFQIVYDDLYHLKGVNLNQSLPFYEQSFVTLKKLKSISVNQSLDSAQKMFSSVAPNSSTTSITSVLNKSRVFDSSESELGLLPTNEFFSHFLSRIYQSQYYHNAVTERDGWDLSEFLEEEQLIFLKCLGIV